jgi:hypothetical protein
MDATTHPQLTRLLRAWSGGEAGAADQVLPASALLAPGAHAAILTVGRGADCSTSSLAAAIYTASVLSGADEIRINQAPPKAAGA